MTIYGVALLAACTLLGAWLGEMLGMALGVKANVGGVGMAMLMLIAARYWLSKPKKGGGKPIMSHGMKFGVEFWAMMYIPIVVAMAATQNVVVAVKGGPMVAIAAIATVALCFGCVWLLGKLWPPEKPSVTPVEGAVIAGDPDAAAKGATP
jgi:malonate transporter MadL subunit